MTASNLCRGIPMSTPVRDRLLRCRGCYLGALATSYRSPEVEDLA